MIRRLTIAIALVQPLAFVCAAAVDRPLVVFTDLLSGPNDGGENNLERERSAGQPRPYA